MEIQGQVTLKHGRAKKIRNQYPWVQREELHRKENVEDGVLTRVLDAKQEFLAIGTYNGKSRFPVRILTLEDEPINEEFFARRFRESIPARESLKSITDSWRVVFSEADHLPGLIIDQFNGHYVVQVRSLAMENLKSLWLPALLSVFQPKTIYEKSEMAGRKEEGLDARVEHLHGSTPDVVEMTEHDMNLLVPIAEGLKTGFYLDQRNTRHDFSQFVRPGDKVLDTFCYTGGFSLAATRAGAKCTGVDILPIALDTARENARRNKLEIPFIEANAFEYLEAGADGLGPFDHIILDPPAIAKTSEKRDALKWAIWKLVYHALPLLKPGGTLMVCNCSYQLTWQSTIEACRIAASDKGTTLNLERLTFQDIDHPAPIHFPESLYLKCLWLRKGR